MHAGDLDFQTTEPEVQQAPPAEDVSMTLPCGTHLAARIWRPAASGTHPVLLMRQPYGREIASTVTLANPSWYAAQGYIVVVQDVRGAGASEGRFDPLLHEAADGAAAADWARALPGGNGRLGLYGFSYQAMTQHLALAGGAAADAIVPVMGPWDLWRDLASEGGAFRLDWNVGWAMQLGALSARHRGDRKAFAAFRRAAAAPEIDGDRPALPQLARDHPDLCHLADWVGAIGDPSFWQARSPGRMALDAPAALRTPALHVGGWYDLFLPGSVAAHAAFAGAGAPARLVIGPWSHLSWQGGDLSVDRLTVDWFDRFLNGRDGGTPEPALSLFDVTRREWRDFDDWPTQTRRFWLSGDGLSAAHSSGLLLTEPPATASHETFVHDPWRPVPARGHHLGAPFGAAERADLDARADVAVFTSATLAHPLRLAGAPVLRLRIGTDAPSCDLHAVLSVLTGDGAVRTLTAGHQRMAASKDTPVTFDLRPIAATLEPGDRLRLSLSGAAWPAFTVNPGTGAAPETTPVIDHRPITLTLATPARLDLKVAP